MAAISREEVAHLARLSRLAVTDEELDRFAGQLDVILQAVARVGEVAAADIPPTSHSVPLTNVLRDDVVVPGLASARRRARRRARTRPRTKRGPASAAEPGRYFRRDRRHPGRGGLRPWTDGSSDLAQADARPSSPRRLGRVAQARSPPSR